MRNTSLVVSMHLRVSSCPWVYGSQHPEFSGPHRYIGPQKMPFLVSQEKQCYGLFLVPSLILHPISGPKSVHNCIRHDQTMVSGTRCLIGGRDCWILVGFHVKDPMTSQRQVYDIKYDPVPWRFEDDATGDW